MKSIDGKIIRQIFTLVIIVIIGLMIFRELLPYFSGVLGAITIYVLMRKWMDKLVSKGWRPPIAAALLMFISFVGILIPVTGIIFIVSAFKDQLSEWEERLGYDISSEIDVTAISSWLSENLQNIAGNTFNIFIAIAIMYFLLYYLFTSPKGLTNTMVDFIPFNKKNRRLIGDESVKMVRSNALGIPLVALAQGIVALIGFLIFGVEDPLFWFVIVTVGSMIPFVGTLVGILPVFILSLSGGETFQAWGILLYGFIIVGSTDNLIRLYVLKKLDNVHPLITLIGVIIGVPIFGFIGLIFGPLLLSLFFIVVRIYQKEFGEQIS